MTDDTGLERLDIPPWIQALERALAVAIIVRDYDDGPPVEIEAVGLVDSESSVFIASGATADEAWRELGVQVAAWRNVDPRIIRTVAGGA